MTGCVDLTTEDIVIVGGGGLGTGFFRKHLDSLKRKDRPYKLIAWGVGVDNISDITKILDPQKEYELFGDWFDGFDEVGTRCFSEEQKYRWVPCTSCLHPAFFEYRDKVPSKSTGIYEHKRVPLGGTMDNSGDSLEEKLEFLSDHEIIITNTYHGVYWATLLNRKVVCIPFKSGLFSFKHPPVYSDTIEVSDDILHDAKSYPDSLEECCMANVEFYNYLFQNYGI